MSSPAVNAASGPPPPPPTMFPTMRVPPPLPGCFPPLPNNNVPTPPKPSLLELSNDSNSSTIKKNKKTVKLFWREIQENPIPLPIRPKVGGFIWDDLPNVSVDTNMLEHLFESRTNDLIIKVSSVTVYEYEVNFVLCAVYLFLFIYLFIISFFFSMSMFVTSRK